MNLISLHYLHSHLQCEDGGEDMVSNGEDPALGGPGGDGGPLHGQGDAVTRYKHQNYKVKPALHGHGLDRSRQ